MPTQSKREGTVKWGEDEGRVKASRIYQRLGWAARSPNIPRPGFVRHELLRDIVSDFELGNPI